MGKGHAGHSRPEVADRPTGLLLCGAERGARGRARWQDLPLLIGLQSWGLCPLPGPDLGCGKADPTLVLGGPCPGGWPWALHPQPLFAPRWPESLEPGLRPFRGCSLSGLRVWLGPGAAGKSRDQAPVFQLRTPPLAPAPVTCGPRTPVGGRPLLRLRPHTPQQELCPFRSGLAGLWAQTLKPFRVSLLPHSAHLGSWKCWTCGLF